MIRNLAVLAAAEQFTDGRLTDAILADVARMIGQPLHVAVQPYTPDAAEVARRAVLNAEAKVREFERLVAFQRRAIGDANRARTPEARRRLRSIEFGMLNRRRAQLREAHITLGAARVALDDATGTAIDLAA